MTADDKLMQLAKNVTALSESHLDLAQQVSRLSASVARLTEVVAQLAEDDAAAEQ